MNKPLEKFEVRAERVLAETFDGMHHIRGEIKKTVNRWEVCVKGELASCDFNYLTRLVLAAHHHCVRVAIIPFTASHLKLEISYRSRDGSQFERHPTISESLAVYYKWTALPKESDQK